MCVKPAKLDIPTSSSTLIQDVTVGQLRRKRGGYSADSIDMLVLVQYLPLPQPLQTSSPQSSVSPLTVHTTGTAFTGKHGMQCKSMGSTQSATEAFMGLSRVVRVRAMHGKSDA